MPWNCLVQNLKIIIAQELIIFRFPIPNNPKMRNDETCVVYNTNSLQVDSYSCDCHFLYSWSIDTLQRCVVPTVRSCVAKLSSLGKYNAKRCYVCVKLLLLANNMYSRIWFRSRLHYWYHLIDLLPWNITQVILSKYFIIVHSMIFLDWSSEISIFHQNFDFHQNFQFHRTFKYYVYPIWINP